MNDFLSGGWGFIIWEKGCFLFLMFFFCICMICKIVKDLDLFLRMIFIFYYNYWYIKKCFVILYDLVCSWNISVVEGYDVEVLFKVFYDVSIVKGRFICILVKIFKGKGILGIKKKL